jgi:hypothetical protein
MSQPLQSNQQIETNRPAPILPGFYSMQALSDESELPHITQYNRKPEPLVRWKNKMTKQRLFDAFALCSSDARWDVFNRSGKTLGTRTSITPKNGGLFSEICHPVKVDLDEYDTSVKAILGDTVCRITSAEHHQQASSVGHSNMVVVARHMIMDASDADLEHIYLADSIASGCRVQGWFMDSSKISSRLMDKYLDRYKWLSKGWPLANDHHMQVLAYRMATLRPLQVFDILRRVNEVLPIGEHEGMIVTRVQQVRPDALIAFTAKMLEGLEPGLLLAGYQDLEEIDEETIILHAHRIARLYKEAFL